MIHYRNILNGLFAVFFAGALALSGCKSDTTTPVNGSYQTTYLVSDTSEFAINVLIDQNLKNAWGIAVGPTGKFWVSSNHAGVSTIYDANGAISAGSPVSIPSRDNPLSGGEPTGVVYNG